MNQPLFALIDCNNFFVSCERLFRPDLEGRPVVVLSSNDGCAVARSNEAKTLGIPMGAPAFKYRQLFKAQGVVCFSGNFDLYGDVSGRLVRLLTRVTPHIEVYSVDESFLELGGLLIDDYEAWGRQLAGRIRRQIGIPVSVGLATSKTLAKAATERAKRLPELSGALSLIDRPERLIDEQLAAIAVQDVWGIGWRLGPKLKAEGIHTALELKHCPPRLAGSLMGVHGRQLVSELNGTSCYPLEPARKVRQSIMHGRLFGEDTAESAVIEAAIASLTATATARLRREGLLATQAVVRLATNRHRPGYQRLLGQVRFAVPTADSGRIAAELLANLGDALGGHTQYHRADILLHGLVPARHLQLDVFGAVDPKLVAATARRLEAIDTISGRYGRHSLRYAAELLSHAWEPKRALRSPRYTTSWQELPYAHIRQPHADRPAAGQTPDHFRPGG